MPDLACNLMSGFSVTLEGEECAIMTNGGHVIGKGIRHGGLYRLVSKTMKAEEHTANAAAMGDSVLWHNRLGHINHRVLKQMGDAEIAKGVNIPKGFDHSFYEDCVKAKAVRTTPKPIGEIKTKRKLELIHTDVCGPCNITSASGKRYFITFTNDYTRKCHTAFLARKSEALEAFRGYHASVDGETGGRIGRLISDRGGEYMGAEFREYLRAHHIHDETTETETPEQNGVAEGLNGTLMEKSIAMLSHATMEKKYWAEAVKASSYLHNRTVTSSLGRKTTPYECWYGRKPDLTHLRVFGCVGYTYVFKGQRRKLDDMAHMLRMVGYSTGTRGYRLLDENTRRISYRRDVVFNKDRFTTGDVTREKQSEKMTVEVQENSHNVEVNAPPEIGLGLVRAADIGL